MLFGAPKVYLKMRILCKFTCIILTSAILLLLMLANNAVLFVQIKDHIDNWSILQLCRKAVLSSACTKHNLITPNITFAGDIAERLYVEHNHKVIYCQVPKSGCTNWKRILILLHMNLTRVRPEDIAHETVHYNSPMKTLSSYPREQWLPLLNRYTKLIFTRDPFERLVSAYRNKFLHTSKNPYYRINVSNIILKKFRKDKNSTERVTFLEFVQHVLSGKPETNNNHWRPIYDLCDPCNIHYDILGKVSTIDEDSAQVLRIIQAPEDLHFPDTQEYAGVALTDKEITKSYFTNLTDEYVQKIISHYQLDAILFDYPMYSIDMKSQEHI